MDRIRGISTFVITARRTRDSRGPTPDHRALRSWSQALGRPRFESERARASQMGADDLSLVCERPRGLGPLRCLSSTAAQHSIKKKTQRRREYQRNGGT